MLQHFQKGTTSLEGKNNIRGNQLGEDTDGCSQSCAHRVCQISDALAFGQGGGIIGDFAERRKDFVLEGEQTRIFCSFSDQDGHGGTS